MPARGGRWRLPTLLCLAPLLLAPADALAAGGWSSRPARAALRTRMLRASEPAGGEPGPGAAAGGAASDADAGMGLVGREAPDLEGLDFEARLQVLAKQYENVVPVDPKVQEEEDKLAPAREWDDDEKFWKPDFWTAVFEDVKDVEYPSIKKVTQTLFISQVAFVVVIVLVLVFDALADATIRSVLLGDDFSITMDKILKTAGKTQPM
ncbi:hypothetical protein EMIHUDRAFT_433367 [Emiliania huxleyi CCMP1516]|uniref:Uncharacterized protein n=2 Tax=Emiliania huxleyi TaxID=2903 RepID=A0A0D3L0A4_EMIH1|nr:hypothetical protein EMIHUDRAFT_425211 [Emiliania huxleyi CCMP1516]XP_005793868.1 hypothetical protein EMIHUDRAFT_433367 [Emiliania huxleyi CCMP1516]EOD12779.1 hypothetical protein EMIHUDRAFT_425211 [Emiliania huxleyi CCMP1516]EOD41439.1 hypothetical protein EMIHUDRAFT_433367 [Emiliania huxleyi CCMP1516]|eukprot:XP_005765208.1 hypothetical protein EMIHUDRAFT_425211 [Emiliania huxleyi CCMP1516]